MRTEPAQLALEAILQKPTLGIPTFWLNLMEHAFIERVAGAEPGAYTREPEETYIACQRAAGVSLLDQYIPENPLTMGASGFEGARPTATTGAEEVVVDGILVDSPEAVVEHLERVEFPRLRTQMAAFDEESRVREIIDGEARLQGKLGPSILKGGYAFVHFPHLPYTTYGYRNYFIAYELYPEVMEEHFSLTADLALLNNRAAARAYGEGHLPPWCRLDHDMADGRGTLVRMESLERRWFPHFDRCLEPLRRAGVRMVWHCDGNLMGMVPGLLAAGISGFQGFQYEHGMDYERLCARKTTAGDDLLIVAGVSVTRTLPWGTPADVRRELAWLVEKGPKRGLFLGCSSSVTPGVPWPNIQALLDGLAYYRTSRRL